MPLIHLTGEALMEDHHLVIGSDIPINLKIYLNDAESFFDLFTSTETKSQSESSQFFGRKNKGKKGKMDIREAAFRLLQWAQYGEEMEIGREEKGVKVEGISEMKLDASNGNNEEDDCSVASSTTKELYLDTTEDGDYEELLESEEVKELNQLVAKGHSKSIPELSDPSGFKDGVTLRPYQRQALFWMCRREGMTYQQLNMEGEEEDINDEELQLLAELTAPENRSDMQIWGGKGIACDCGPVVVEDEDIATRAVPVADYGKQAKHQAHVHHPLWKRRFLATQDMRQVYAFYVNELLGIATSSPPNPPRQCVGGILADAMGLGKIPVHLCQYQHFHLLFSCLFI
jgi:SNF2 family DNA or RNA helicase